MAIIRSITNKMYIINIIIDNHLKSNTIRLFLDSFQKNKYNLKYFLCEGNYISLTHIALISSLNMYYIFINRICEGNPPKYNWE